MSSRVLFQTACGPNPGIHKTTVRKDVRKNAEAYNFSLSTLHKANTHFVKNLSVNKVLDELYMSLFNLTNRYRWISCAISKFANKMIISSVGNSHVLLVGGHDD